MKTPESSSKEITPSGDKANKSKDTAGATSNDNNDSKHLDKESFGSQGITTSITTSGLQDRQVESAKSNVPSPITPLHFTSLFTTKDEHIVSSILRHSNFTPQAIKYLMMTSKIRTFPQVANMTQEDWKGYIENNNVHLKTTDFIQIVVFQW